MRFLVGLTYILLAWSESAFGYIDPGSGSAIMSAIVGFFVAAGMFIKTYWYKLKSIMTFGSSRSEENVTPKHDDSATSGDPSAK